MKKALLLFLILLQASFATAQSGDCNMAINLCDPGPFPASISNTGPIVAAGTNFGCMSDTDSPEFFYFESGVNGPLNIVIDPVNAAGTIIGNDLDFVCWGPFSSTANMCNQLTAGSIQDCSISPASSETCNIANAVSGQIYVIMVCNWWWSWLSPNPCNINFTPSAPFSCCEFAGDDNAIDVCDTDSPFDLITELNNSPSSGGVWEDATGNVVSNMFDPSTDPGGIYSYIIAGTSSCVADTGFVTINLTITPSLSITSPLTACSGISPITLTASPAGGFFSGTNVTGNSFDPSIIGNNNITYSYTTNGCTATTDTILTVMESPTVLTPNIITTIAHILPVSVNSCTSPKPTVDKVITVI